MRFIWVQYIHFKRTQLFTMWQVEVHFFESPDHLYWVYGGCKKIKTKKIRLVFIYSFRRHLKFKHVTFDGAGKVWPFKGKNPIFQASFLVEKKRKKEKCNLKISSRICYFFECLTKYHTRVRFEMKGIKK